MGDKLDGKCIHQTERLYNALYKKLHKRGKKDFAIQVFYNSRPAKVKLPHCLYGPHITGAFNYIKGLQPYYKPIGYNSYLNTYGLGGYNHLGYGQAWLWKSRIRRRSQPLRIFRSKLRLPRSFRGLFSRAFT